MWLFRVLLYLFIECVKELRKPKEKVESDEEEEEEGSRKTKVLCFKS